MRLLVGLTTSNLSSLRHSKVELSCSSRAVGSTLSTLNLLNSQEVSGKKIFTIRDDQPLIITCSGNVLQIDAASGPLPAGTALEVSPVSATASIAVSSLRRSGAKGATTPRYHGTLFVLPDNDHIRIILQTDLETYIKGVLQSEIPASYEMEAIKAQAVTARTYALNPRINHAPDNCNVCDSYLCCQYFAGLQAISARHQAAITATAGQIITFAEKPILALFSSCAGGHTENYEDCFSDPVTGQFPPQALPYLKGVAEGKLPSGYTARGATEQALRALWAQAHPDTADSWATQFRWSAKITGDSLENHLHHVVTSMLDDKKSAPFIVPPQSNRFGQIHAFAVPKRGIAGTAIDLTIDTSAGTWLIKKELIIRSLFNLPEMHLVRLKSGKIFFDHHYDRLGLLSSIDVHGLGSGHGVGLQQTGAQGWAKVGRTYREIIAHYFTDVEITNI